MLEVTGIEKRYRGRTILKNVSFRANPGACIGIVGGNGCGKTTLLSILAGIRKPDRGSIRIDGQEALGRHRLLEEKIAYVPQENPLIPELTAFDNYRLWFRGKRREMERDLECGVGRVLGVDRFLKTQAGRLSGGEKKKAEILQMLLLKPSLAILDETDSGLDVDAVRTVSLGVKEYQKDRDGGLLIITHSTRILESLQVDKTHIMEDGRIVKTGDASLVERINRMGVEQFLDEADQNSLCTERMEDSDGRKNKGR